MRGGTGHAIRVARAYDIPVWNIFEPNKCPSCRAPTFDDYGCTGSCGFAVHSLVA